MESKKHVQIPQANKIDKIHKLKLLDYLVYANIKRFANKDTLISVVSIDTLAQLCGMTRKSIINSIEKLEKANMFTVLRSSSEDKKNCNKYQFKELDKFEKFSEEFLKSNLPNKVKAY